MWGENPMTPPPQAAKAREDVLIELMHWMKEDCRLIFKLFSTGKMFYVEPYDESQFNAELLYLKIESLRSKGGEQ